MRLRPVSLLTTLEFGATLYVDKGFRGNIYDFGEA